MFDLPLGRKFFPCRFILCWTCSDCAELVGWRGEAESPGPQRQLSRGWRRGRWRWRSRLKQLRGQGLPHRTQLQRGPQRRGVGVAGTILCYVFFPTYIDRHLFLFLLFGASLVYINCTSVMLLMKICTAERPWTVVLPTMHSFWWLMLLPCLNLFYQKNKLA